MVLPFATFNSTCCSTTRFRCCTVYWAWIFWVYHNL